MPGFDGTGPVGRGEMTGWGRGDCIVPLRRVGRGLADGQRPRAGRGQRRWSGSVDEVSVRSEIEQLRRQIADLQQAMAEK